MKRILFVLLVLIVFSIMGFLSGVFSFNENVTSKVVNIIEGQNDIILKINEITYANCLDDCTLTQVSEGNQYYVVDVTIENLSPAEYLFNPLNLKIRDVKGYAYRHSFLGTELENYFSVTSIPSGTLASGRLAFELPIYAEGLQVELDSSVGKTLQNILI